ncbi:MAG: glycosyltransferase family 4 protein [Gemmatimonadota bacterium]|nr:glycosyltransferase family 4 protein [Gemmatimonadota bacterium]
MKLLVVNWQDRFNPHAGGAEVHLHEIFGRMAARGHQITLLTSGWPSAVTCEWVDGIEVHRVGSRYTFAMRAPGYHRRHLATRHFDGVVDALNKIPLFTPLWAGRPVVLLVHHLFGATAFHQASLPVAAATWLLERPLARAYQGLPVQAISSSTAEDLVARGVESGRITVIHPGVDTEYFAPAARESRSPRPAFLYLGRLQRYKRVDLIIQAVALLRDRGVSATLLIAGRGEHEGALRRLTSRLKVGDCVRFLGYVTEDEKRELFRAAWANVFASPKEGWGITNVEAAACGTPSVASDAPGLRESVRNGETGFLVPHGDVAALAAALETLAQHPGTVESMGRSARAFAERFTWDRAAAETEKHLQTAFGIAEGGALCPH